jgi:hypothetical protein
VAPGIRGNGVIELAADNPSHAACPVPAAILGVVKVDLGLNWPCPATITFEVPSNECWRIVNLRISV